MNYTFQVVSNKRQIWMATFLIALLFVVVVIIGGCKNDEKVLYLGMMVHLEGWNEEVINEDMFIRHADAARKLASIFEDYEAKATFEARPEFAAACNTWNDNVLLELHNRGHGIGVHADVGGGRGLLTQQGFTMEIAEMKNKMKKLTGIEILHVSGICSELDWVKASIDAEYKFVTGTIGYCVMSMPENNRPDEYKECPNPGECHGVVPVNLKDRINPWRTATGEDWLKDDPDGDLVVLTESGVIGNLAEYAKGEGSIGGQFTQADIDVYIQMLEEALTYAKDGEVNFLYVALSIGSPDINEAMYRKWLAAIQPYVDSGKVEWKTLPEIYTIYRDQQ